MFGDRVQITLSCYRGFVDAGYDVGIGDYDFGRFVINTTHGYQFNPYIFLGTQPEGMIQANKCEGVVYEDPIRVSNEIAALLKDEEGCDLVVCLSHLGIQMDEHLVAGTRNIDVILGGHSHTFMKGPKTYLNMDGKEVPVMHTGKNGVRVGRLDLTLKHK